MVPTSKCTARRASSESQLDLTPFAIPLCSRAGAVCLALAMLMKALRYEFEFDKWIVQGVEAVLKSLEVISQSSNRSVQVFNLEFLVVNCSSLSFDDCFEVGDSIWTVLVLFFFFVYDLVTSWRATLWTGLQWTCTLSTQSCTATPKADNLEVGAKLCEADNAPSVIFRRRIQAWARARAWTQRTSPLGKSCVKFDHHEIHALFGGESFGWGRGPARKILTDLRRLGENILA
mmetsp:Transcript_21840/g.56964  ORF Transcript_21840/g.56964 Transcript_21840/m.56964 type:complete len:232 (-) Transcript_21840:1254-1949(-)